MDLHRRGLLPIGGKLSSIFLPNLKVLQVAVELERSTLEVLRCLLVGAVKV